MENSYEIASASLNRMSCKLYQLSNQIATSVITAAKAKIRANLNDLCLKVGSNTIYYKGTFYAGSIDNLEDKNVILEPKDEDTLNEIIHLNKEVNKDKEYFFRLLAIECDDRHISECIKKIPRKCSDADVLRNIFPEYCYIVLHNYFPQEDNYRCIESVIKLPQEFKDKFMYYVGISLL